MAPSRLRIKSLFPARKPRPNHRRRPTRAIPNLETLEDRIAPATVYNVTEFDDPAPDGCVSGTDCSLREAVIAANADGDDSIIKSDKGRELIYHNPDPPSIDNLKKVAGNETRVEVT